MQSRNGKDMRNTILLIQFFLRAVKFRLISQEHCIYDARVTFCTCRINDTAKIFPHPVQELPVSAVCTPPLYEFCLFHAEGKSPCCMIPLLIKTARIRRLRKLLQFPEHRDSLSHKRLLLI